MGDQRGRGEHASRDRLLAASVHRLGAAGRRPGRTPTWRSPALEYGAQAAGYLRRAPALDRRSTARDGNPISGLRDGQHEHGPGQHVRRRARAPLEPNTWGVVRDGGGRDTGISNDGVTARGGLAADLAARDGGPRRRAATPPGSTAMPAARAASRCALLVRGNAWLPLGSDVVSSDVYLPAPVPGGGASGPSLSLTVGRDNLPIVAWSQGAATGNEVYVRKFSPIAGWHELGPGSAAGGGVSASARLLALPGASPWTRTTTSTRRSWRGSTTAAGCRRSTCGAR